MSHSRLTAMRDFTVSDRLSFSVAQQATTPHDNLKPIYIYISQEDHQHDGMSKASVLCVVVNSATMAWSDFNAGDK